MKHIKTLISDIFNELQTVERIFPFDEGEFEKALELYGKEVARNVRHKAAEISRSNQVSHAIMNIQFKDVDSNP